MKGPTRTGIDRPEFDRASARRVPADELLRINPCLEHQLARGAKLALDEDFTFGDTRSRIGHESSRPFSGEGACREESHRRDVFGKAGQMLPAPFDGAVFVDDA